MHTIRHRIYARASHANSIFFRAIYRYITIYACIYITIIPEAQAGVSLDFSVCRTTSGKNEGILFSRIPMRRLLNGRIVEHVPYTNQEMNIYAWRDDDKFDVFIHENIESPAQMTSFFGLSMLSSGQYGYTINGEEIIVKIVIVPGRLYKDRYSCLESSP